MSDPEPNPSTRTAGGIGGRPSVDVVTPFVGSPEDLERVIRHLASLRTHIGDTVTVADNRPNCDGSPPPGGVRVVEAPERRSSYHARNRGAAAGSADWIVFLDADVVAPPGLIDGYFEPPPDDDVAVLAGAIRDEPPGAGASFAVRYSARRRTLAQENTLNREWGYAQTANCAVRRTAFEAVGGFRADVRSGGDADLCFRLRAAGWQLEPRFRAEVIHRSRPTMRALLRQRMRHGAGIGWLQREYPGSVPGFGDWAELVKWTLRRTPTAAVGYAWSRREEDLVALADLAVRWAMEVGRFLPNRVGAARSRSA